MSGCARTRGASSSLAGHERLEVEAVVERLPGYLVVEKLGAAANEAEALDLAIEPVAGSGRAEPEAHPQLGAAGRG